MSQPSKVILDQTEIEAMMFLAELRYMINRGTGVDNFHNTTDRPHMENEVMGLCGEYAFGKMFNLFMNVSQNPSGRAGEADFIGRDGSHIDVKTTKPDKAFSLRVPVLSSPPAHDYYVLMIDHSPIFVYAGYCTVKELVARNPKAGTKPGAPDYFWVPRQKLHIETPK